MAIHSPYFYAFRLDAINGETFCVTNWEPAFKQVSTHTRYYTALLFVVLIVPLVSVSTLQTITLLKLRKDNMVHFRTSIANQRHKKNNKNLLKMSAVIVMHLHCVGYLSLPISFFFFSFRVQFHISEV